MVQRAFDPICQCNSKTIRLRSAILTAQPSRRQVYRYHSHNRPVPNILISTSLHSEAFDRDSLHHDRDVRAILRRRTVVDLENDVHPLNDLAKDGVGTRRLRVEPVQEVIVDGVDEKLGAARVGCAGIGH